MKKYGHVAKVLVPSGWSMSWSDADEDFECFQFQATPPPRLIQWILRFQNNDEGERLVVWVTSNRDLIHLGYGGAFGAKQPTIDTTYAENHTSDGKTWIKMNYYRSDHRAFDRTYEKICNSLRIE